MFHVNKGRIHYIRNYLFDSWKRLPSKQCCKYHALPFISTGLLIQWKRNHNESFCRMWSVILNQVYKRLPTSRGCWQEGLCIYGTHIVWTLTKSNYFLLSNWCWIISVINNTSDVHLLLPQPIFRRALAAAFKVTHREIANFAMANWFSSSYDARSLMRRCWILPNVEFSMCLFGNPIIDGILLNCYGLHKC